jgi:hypothetical protein
MGESALQGGSSHNDFLQGLNWLSGRDGCSTSFWLNPWLHGRSVEEVMPNLFTTLSGRQWHRHSVAKVLKNKSWLGDIARPLTVPVLVQYVLFHEQVEAITLDPTAQDSTIWRWDPSGVYSTSSTYEALFLG